MSSEHMRANAIVDAARAEMYNAEADVRETKMQRDEAAKAVEKAEKAEKRAKRQLTQTTKAAIKDRGAVYKTPEGEIVARTFTAGKAAAKEGGSPFPRRSRFLRFLRLLTTVISRLYVLAVLFIYVLGVLFLHILLVLRPLLIVSIRVVILLRGHDLDHLARRS